MKNKILVNMVLIFIFALIILFYLLYKNSDITVLLDIRLPKLLLAIIAGIGLGLSGLTFQSIFRNPLAEPYLLGVSSGAALGAVIGFYFNLQDIGQYGIFYIMILSFMFGIATIFLVFYFSDFFKKFNFLFLILSGIILNVFLYTVEYLIIASDFYRLNNVLLWLWGRIPIYNLYIISGALFFIFIYIFILLYNYKVMNLLSISREFADTKGYDTKKTMLLILIATTFITSLVVSLCGIIGFVGLIVPHIARLLVGHNYKDLIITTSIVGGIFLIISELISRILFYPAVIPIGIISALIGAPVFFYLLKKSSFYS